MNLTRDIFKKPCRLTTKGYGSGDFLPYQDKAGKWRWSFTCTQNGEIIAASEQGRANLDDNAENARLILACAWRLADKQPEGGSGGTDSK